VITSLLQGLEGFLCLWVGDTKTGKSLDKIRACLQGVRLAVGELEKPYEALDVEVFHGKGSFLELFPALQVDLMIERKQGIIKTKSLCGQAKCKLLTLVKVEKGAIAIKE